MGLMDKAAACLVVYDYKPECPEMDATKKRICKIICCCNEFPIRRAYRLKQLCVDRTLQALGVPDGILPGVPYDMATTPPQVIRDVRTFPGNVVATRLKKLLTGEYFQDRIRIPDVTVLKDPAGSINDANIEKIYEIKFPNDKPRHEQIKDYEKIVGKDSNRVDVLYVENCHCKDMPEDPEEVEGFESEINAMQERLNASAVAFIDEHRRELYEEMKELNLYKEIQFFDIHLNQYNDPNYLIKVIEVFMMGKTPRPLGKIRIPIPKSPVPLPVPAP